MVFLRRTIFLALIAVIVSSPALVAQPDSLTVFTPELEAPDLYTLKGEKSFVTGYPAINEDGTFNAVIEIPAGTTAKWEVNKPDGSLKWEFEDGKPRIVQYLGYPGNYGMVPRTLLPKELGGDGDPLDVLVLGDAVPRGSVVKAKMIGVLKLLDRGEQDDKLIAVLSGTPLAKATSLAELDKLFPGVLTIVETWFVNYKGVGKMKSAGFQGVAEAESILKTAISQFAESKSLKHSAPVDNKQHMLE